MVRSNAKQRPTLRDVSNAEIARQLDELADRLTQQGANPFRSTAYRTAAANVRSLAQPLQAILQREGLDGLLQLPGVGPSIGRAVEKFILTGKMPLLEQLRGNSGPERIFATVAEIGPKLAAQIHEQLGIETLAELQTAAWNGRLAQVPGMGHKRVQAVRESLAGRFQQPPAGAMQRTFLPPADEPPIAELLEIDEEYRRLAERDRLPRIAPRRFNPDGKAWLPILHTQRDDRNYTAMFSNTARAHELGTSHDWVVIYRSDERTGSQWTVVTSSLGKLKGRRVVRGRERDCAEHYAATGLA